jgi:cytidyltransferase-like protein
MNKTILISGGFDPLHAGHIAYINAAKQLGTRLVIALNSDEWLTRKKTRQLLDYNDRETILINLKAVDEVYPVKDQDGSVTDAIHYCLNKYPNDDIIFANGGDRTDTNIPEMQIQNPRLSFVFGVGGTDKINSSSKILSEWKNPKTERTWGYYRVLHSDGPETKVKELTVHPHQKLSLQKHDFRSEHWIVSSGTATVKVGEKFETHVLTKHQEIHIPVGSWHQLCNDTDEELRLVEIQYGKLCIEEDIYRL